MTFDTKKFLNTKYTQREKDVPVKELSDYFPEGEPAVWRVKGITGNEYGQIMDGVSRRKNMKAVIESLSGDSSSSDKVAAIKSLLGLDGKTNPNVAIRIDTLIAGSVSPVCDTELALKICKCFPVVFRDLTDEILTLTGLGYEPGKPACSGEMAASGQV